MQVVSIRFGVGALLCAILFVMYAQAADRCPAGYQLFTDGWCHRLGHLRCPAGYFLYTDGWCRLNGRNGFQREDIHFGGDIARQSTRGRPVARSRGQCRYGNNGMDTSVIVCPDGFFKRDANGVFHRVTKDGNHTRPITEKHHNAQRSPSEGNGNTTPSSPPSQRPPLDAEGILPYIFHFPAQKLTRFTGLLGDVESHLPASYGNQYIEPSDHITTAHETSHGISSFLRNRFFRGTGRSNAFYLLNNKAIVLKEPPMRKSAVNRFVPKSLRGFRFRQYLVGQDAWDDSPLYLADEWNSYVNGAAVGVDLARHGKRTRWVTDGLLEFNVYAIALGASIERNAPQYFRSSPFKSFLKFNLERAMQVYRAARHYPSLNWVDGKTYWHILATSPDAQYLRSFLERNYGKEWVTALLHT